jgi:hypothetical protein
MATTYSLSVTGVSASNPYQPTKLLDIPDQVCSSAGDEQNAMQTGTSFLVHMPDGSQVWHVFDTERCIPGVARVLRRLY